jgi:hypothetical protein
MIRALDGVWNTVINSKGGITPRRLPNPGQWCTISSSNNSSSSRCCGIHRPCKIGSSSCFVYRTTAIPIPIRRVIVQHKNPSTSITLQQLEQQQQQHIMLICLPGFHNTHSNFHGNKSRRHRHCRQCCRRIHIRGMRRRPRHCQ